MTKKSYKSTKTIFASLFSSPKHQLLKELEQKLHGRADTTVIFTPNLEQLALASKQKNFAQALGLADFLLPDGMGLVWGSRFLAHFGKSQPVSERISGREIVLDLLKLIQNQEKQPVLIIGGKDYDQLTTTTATKTNSTQGMPVFKLAHDALQTELYWTPGFKNIKKPSHEEEQSLLKLISRLKPAIVFVAFGAPDQELWISENLSALNSSGVKIAMAVGGSFDVIFGKLQRPPGWIEQSGLEWLYRLWQEPWRWRRQLQLFVALKLIIQLALQDEDDHLEG